MRQPSFPDQGYTGAGLTCVKLISLHIQDLGAEGLPAAQRVRICLSVQGDTGSIPWPEKIPHGREQLGPCAATIEPVL